MIKMFKKIEERKINNSTRALESVKRMERENENENSGPGNIITKIKILIEGLCSSTKTQQNTVSTDWVTGQ